MVSRRGGGPDWVERVAADAGDADRLTELAKGAEAIYNCANPRYYEWDRVWPPLARAILTAAGRSSAVLVTMGNLYAYGPVAGAMTEDLPLRATTVKGRVRAQMWRDALAAHESGRVRVTEARASDFIDHESVFSGMVAPAVLKGRRAFAPVDFDVPHSLSYTGDVGRTLAALGTDERAWGRAWHVPTAPAVTLREAARRLAALAETREPRLSTMPGAALRLVAITDPVARAFMEMRYQFGAPFVLDSTAAQETFGLKPTSLDDALRTLL
jgi:uncharacterized protein YbjT (DUF2867 family)